MVDLDGLLWVPYLSNIGEPLMIVERKPEKAAQNGWYVTQALAARAHLPGLLVVELENGLYRIFGATEVTGYRPRRFLEDVTIEGWYEKVEKPLRERAQANLEVKTIEDLLR
jgi:hypothetical protein